ncbi:hypothetical protein EON77_17170 [bacterium]|nr:MAG: hypothetical protein EON77_17170 [bacterium]
MSERVTQQDDHREGLMSQSQPIFTSQDATRLRRMLDDPAIRYRWPTFVEELRRKLGLGHTVDAMKIPQGVATMHSIVRLRDVGASTPRFFVLAYPDEADLRFGRISVLSEVGTALLGATEGEELCMGDRCAERRICLERVVSQPETHAALQAGRRRPPGRPRLAGSRDRPRGLGSPAACRRGGRCNLR